VFLSLCGKKLYKMKSKTCVSISGPTLEKCRHQIADHKLIELRYDLFDFDKKQLDNLYQSDISILATCRPENIGFERQKEILHHAIKQGAEFVDIEIESTTEYWPGAVFSLLLGET